VRVVVEETNGTADSAQDKSRVREWGQVDEADAVDEFGFEGRCDCEGEAGLADAAGAGQGDQAGAFFEDQLADLVDLACSPDQWPGW